LWISIFKHPDCGNGVEVKSSLFGFEVNGVVTSMANNPALNGGPVCADPFSFSIRPYNVAYAMEAVSKVSSIVPDWGIGYTKATGCLRNDQRRVDSPASLKWSNVTVTDDDDLRVIELRLEERRVCPRLLELEEVVIANA
jgi:hypothetical protein